MLLRKPKRPTESRVSYRCLSICVNGGILNLSNFVCMQFFYGCYTVFLLLNKLHLFSLTQHTFILIQLDTLHVCYMFRSVLWPSSGMSLPKPYKGRYNICTCSTKCQDEERGLLLSTFCSKIFRYTWNI